MKLFSRDLLFLGMIFAGQSLAAQNTRFQDPNTIGWYNYFGTIHLSKKVGFHTEYQFRRDELITRWQQSLLRLGVNYQLDPALQIRLGYAWIETFAYGDIPVNGMGRDFTEHRLFQMATLTDRIAPVDISHRFILEQRWVGRYSSADQEKEDEYPLLHRFRYLFRMQVPLKGREMKDRTPYVAVYDELFIGFGKNVNENVFDQNRVGLLFGYRINPAARIEAGYLNQTLQLGREVNQRNVFQRNNGVIVNAYFTIDARPKK